MAKKKKRSRKYPATVDAELDLHGYTADEARAEVTDFLAESRALGYARVRIIVGKGTRSQGGVAVLPDTVKALLVRKGLVYTYAKLQNGGEGALEVSL